MATDYCDPIDVARICNFVGTKGARAIWGTNPTVPTKDEVEAFINDAEADIDDITSQAWGTRAVQILDEYHDIWRLGRELSIHLKQANILPFETSEGDKLEVWNGSAWVEWIDTYTEGRGADYFVDHRLGKIYFLNYRPREGEYKIKISYRYNSGSTVPSPIKRSCALKVGLAIASTPSGVTLFPEGEESTNFKDITDLWQKEIDSKLSKYTVGIIPIETKFYPTLR